MLPYRSWGGPRPGAGRKRQGPRPRVSHRTRAALAARFPVLITVRVSAGLASFRRRDIFAVVRGALACGKARFGCRVVHWSVQSNHLHLLVEAQGRTSLSRGMQGLLVRIAKRVNHHLARRGSVFADRYHDRILRSPREVRHALAYVLNNGLRHGLRFVQRLRDALREHRVPALDPCASGRYFDGWRRHPDVPLPVAPDHHDPPVASARTWLLRIGWRRHRLLTLDEVPGPSGPKARTG